MRFFCGSRFGDGFLFCGSRFGDGFLVECIVSVGGRAKEQKRNRKITVNEYETYDKLGVESAGILVMRKVKFCALFLRISFW